MRLPPRRKFFPPREKKCLTSKEGYSILIFARFGGVAQLARACGSYPQCHRFKSSRRYHARRTENPPAGHPGPLVKWLRHRPFTAVTWVRVPYGSPKKRESDPDSLFFGAAPPARMDPLRSNAKGDSRPLSRTLHADLATGSDFKFTSSPKQNGSAKAGPFCFCLNLARPRDA